jgi:23S rRNA pseudouridine1911/1915/1917 synthase
VEQQEFIVLHDAEGQRLDLFLVSVLGTHSRSKIQKLILDGYVKLEDRSPRPNLPVHAGERIVVSMPEPTPINIKAEDIPLQILYGDDDLVVLNKPAGMVVHPGNGETSGTLVNALLHHLEDLSGIGGELRPGIVHRLDRGTSGVMVVAKNDEAHRELARQFHDREVEKEYVALVWGVVQAGKRIDAPIGRDPVHRKKMSARARRSREAVTRITKARQLPGVTFIHVAIHTGRTHQIRVHLSTIGHPVVGDTLYGGVRRHVPKDVQPVQRLERPFLHSWKLAFKHPTDGRKLFFSSPIPEDLQLILDDLGCKD